MAKRKRSKKKSAGSVGGTHPLIIVPKIALGAPPEFMEASKWQRIVDEACRGIENEGPLSLRRSRCDEARRDHRRAMRRLGRYAEEEVRVLRPTFHGLGAEPMPMRTKLLIGGGLAVIAIVAMNRQKIAETAVTAAEKVKEAAMSAAGTILNLNSIRKAMPKLKASTVPDVLGPLVEALEEAQINTPARIAAFVAQCGHESGDFYYMQELADGSAYEGRKDLGNTQPGDGKRFKGRGPIQLTGRKNYQAFTADVGKKYGMDFEKNPELVAQPKWGFKAAAWFWTTRNLNALADAGKFDEITYRVNGGCNGFGDRDERYKVAREALEVTVPWIKGFNHAKQGPSVCCMKDGKYAVCPAPKGNV